MINVNNKKTVILISMMTVRLFHFPTLALPRSGIKGVISGPVRDHP